MKLEDLSIRDYGDHACCFIEVKQGVKVLWELTKLCNLRCAHCFLPQWSKQDKELSTKQCVSVLDNLSKGTPEVTRIIFSGGEPLTRKDIPTLVQESIARNMYPTLITNGTLMTADIARQLSKAGLTEATISLDGARADVHDLQRGKGTFDKSVKAIGQLVDNGISVDISTVPTKHNIHNLLDLPRLCADLGCVSVTFNGWMIRENMRGTPSDLSPQPKDLSAFLSSIRKVGKEVGMPIQTSRLIPHTPLEKCQAGITMFGLDALGYWHPCLQLSIPHSPRTNAQIVPFEEIQKRFKRTPKNPPCAPKCPDGKDCYGGCPVNKVNGIDRMCALT